MKQQTLEAAAREAAEDCYEMPYNENLINMRIIKEAFEFGAEWQAKQSPWISVKDRLPQTDDDLYIVLDARTNPPGCGVCDFNPKTETWIDYDYNIIYPTHWMPIPSLESNDNE